jgi:hypothetical protein
MRTKLFKNSTHLKVVGVLGMSSSISSSVKWSLLGLRRKRKRKRLGRGTLSCAWRVCELGWCGL